MLGWGIAKSVYAVIRHALTIIAYTLIALFFYAIIALYPPLKIILPVTSLALVIAILAYRARKVRELMEK